MTQYLQKDQNELEVCHIFKSQTYEFKENHETKEMEKGQKRSEFNMNIVKYSKGDSGIEMFGLVEKNTYDSIKKLAKDIVCMGFNIDTFDEGYKEGATPFIINFSIPNFVGETEILNKTEVVFKEDLSDGDKEMLKDEICN